MRIGGEGREGRFYILEGKEGSEGNDLELGKTGLLTLSLLLHPLYVLYDSVDSSALLSSQEEGKGRDGGKRIEYLLCEIKLNASRYRSVHLMRQASSFGDVVEAGLEMHRAKLQE